MFTIGLLYPAAAFPLQGAFIGYVIAVLMAVGIYTDRARGALWDVPTFLLLLWAVLAVANGFRAPVYAIARPEMILALLAAAVYIGARSATAHWPKEGFQASAIQLVIGWLTLVLGLQALFGVYQVFGPASLPRTFAAMEQSIIDTVPAGDPMREGLLHAVREGRASGTLGAPNIFASFCVAGVMLAAGCALGFSDKRARLAAGLSVMVCAIAIILSGSNGGTLALLAGAVIFAAGIYVRRVSIQTAKTFGIIAVVAIGVMVLAVGALAWFSDGENTRWLGRSGMQQRLYYWESATAMWSESPIIGKGAGAFEALYTQYRIPGAGETKETHSWLFRELATNGLFGTMLLGGFFAFALWHGVRNTFALRDEHPRDYALCTGILAGAGALLVHGMVEYSLSHNECLMLLVILLATVAGRYEHRALAPGTQKILPVAAVLAGLLCIYDVYLWRYVPARAEMAREEAEYMMMEGQDPRAILSMLESAVYTDPMNPANWEMRGMFRVRIGDGGALKDYERAISLQPNSARLQENVASYHARRGNLEQALEYQQRAVELHPLDVSHRLNLAELLEDSGNHQAAVEMWQSTSDLLGITRSERERREALGRELGIPAARDENSTGF